MQQFPFDSGAANSAASNNILARCFCFLLYLPLCSIRSQTNKPTIERANERPTHNDHHRSNSISCETLAVLARGTALIWQLRKQHSGRLPPLAHTNGQRKPSQSPRRSPRAYVQSTRHKVVRVVDLKFEQTPRGGAAGRAGVHV